MGVSDYTDENMKVGVSITTIIQRIITPRYKVGWAYHNIIACGLGVYVYMYSI